MSVLELIDFVVEFELNCCSCPENARDRAYLCAAARATASGR